MRLELLKKKDFPLLIIGGAVSSLGSKMLDIALSLYILQTTGSAAKFASLMALSMIPPLILGPIGGVFADWFNKKRMIVLLDFLSGTLILYFSIRYFQNSKLSINEIYTCVILLSTISALYNPVVVASIPSIVKKEELLDANGINSIFSSTVNVLAPILGAAFFGLFGLFILLILDTISFYLSSLSEVFIFIPFEKKQTNLNLESFGENFKEGLIFIKSKKILLVILALALVVNGILSPIDVIGFNYICKIDLKVSNYQIGLLNSIMTASTFLAPILCKIISKKIKLGSILFLDIFIISLLCALLAIVPSKIYMGLFASNLIPFISLMAIGFLINLICSIGNIALATVLQKEIPLNLMGRVQSVMGTIGCIAMPLGQIIYGFLFDNLQSWICVLTIAVSTFIVINILKKPLLSCNE